MNAYLVKEWREGNSCLRRLITMESKLFLYGLVNRGTNAKG